MTTENETQDEVICPECNRLWTAVGHRCPAPDPRLSLKAILDDGGREVVPPTLGPDDGGDVYYCDQCKHDNKFDSAVGLAHHGPSSAHD